MRGTPFDPNNPRPICYTCFRPCTHCLCEAVTPIVAHCNFLLLQHPHERRKYHATAKLLLRALSNAALIRGIYFEKQQIDAALVGQKPYLLFPSKDAVDATEVKLDRHSTVIVIDGTWAEAGKILYRNQFLKQFQSLSFKAPLRSNFTIRKQPKENCLSTIESVGHLLQLNARAFLDHSVAQRYNSLFDIFSKMVDQQLSHFPRMRGGAALPPPEIRTVV